MGIHEYLNRYRVFKSTAHLTDHSVAEVAYMCGFSDSSHFITVFKKHMGTTPTGYKKHSSENGKYGKGIKHYKNGN
jgi:AraC-like DNA-binding protein